MDGGRLMPPSTFPLTHRMKRDTITVAAISFGICLLSGQLVTWFSIVFGVIAFIILARICIKLISDIADKAKSNSKISTTIDKALDKALLRQNFDMTSMPKSVFRFVDSCYWNKRNKLLTATQNTLHFARLLRVLPENYDGELPQYLGFILEKKALYELGRKYGEKRSKLLSTPSLTEAELMRPLRDVEVEHFHNFCKENRLLILKEPQ